MATRKELVDGQKKAEAACKVLESKAASEQRKLSPDEKKEWNKHSVFASDCKRLVQEMDRDFPQAKAVQK